MSADEAERYHRPQLEALADGGADLAHRAHADVRRRGRRHRPRRAARGLPVAIFFTLETDGRLPSGQPLREAIEQVDGATAGAAAYFGIDCAHPTHFAHVLAEDGAWRERIRGLRANASQKSHAELDASDELDTGDPEELGGRLPRAAANAPAAHRARRLLRHQRAPRRGHLRRGAHRCLRCYGVTWNDACRSAVELSPTYTSMSPGSTTKLPLSS